MSAPSYPFDEDIDVMCKDTRDRDRESLRTSALWKLRAQVFGELHPSLETLELTLFQAQGHQNEKQCYKESYHATWRDIIQDEGRAHAIRLATLSRFEAESK